MNSKSINSQTPSNKPRGRPRSIKSPEEKATVWAKYMKTYRNKFKEVKPFEGTFVLSFNAFPEGKLENTFLDMIGTFINQSSLGGFTKAEFMECVIDDKNGMSAQRVVERYNLSVQDKRDVRKVIEGNLDHLIGIDKNITDKRIKQLSGSRKTFHANIDILIEFSNQLCEITKKDIVELNGGNDTTLQECTHPKHDSTEPNPPLFEDGLHPPSFCGEHLNCYKCRAIEEPADSVCCSKCDFKIKEMMDYKRPAKLEIDAEAIMKVHISPYNQWVSENPKLTTARHIIINM